LKLTFFDDDNSFFNQLLTIVSALCSTWFVCGLGGICYLHLVNPRLPENAGRGGWFATPGRIAMVAVSILLIIISCIVTPLGLYSAIKGIIDGVRFLSFVFAVCSTFSHLKTN
jgi:hypothetical protein